MILFHFKRIKILKDMTWRTSVVILLPKVVQMYPIEFWIFSDHVSEYFRIGYRSGKSSFRISENIRNMGFWDIRSEISKNTRLQDWIFENIRWSKNYFIYISFEKFKFLVFVYPIFSDRIRITFSPIHNFGSDHRKWILLPTRGL